MEHTHLFCLPACGGTRPLGYSRFTQARRKKNAVPFLHRFPSTPLSRGCLHPGCFPLWCGREPTSLLNDYIHWAGAAPGTFAMLLVILCLKAGETYLLTRTDSYFICSNRYWTWHKTPTSPIHIRPFNTTSPTTFDFWGQIYQHFGRFVMQKSPVFLLGTAQSTGFLLQPCLSQTISFSGKDSWGYISYFSILNLAVLFSLLKSPDLVLHTTHMN